MNLAGDKIVSNSSTSTSVIQLPDQISHRNISMNSFLEFLKITCQVTDSIMFSECDKNSNDIDYNKLTNNEFIDNLLKTYNESNNESDTDKKTGDLTKKNSSLSYTSVKSNYKNKSNDFTEISTILNLKLNDVVNEGILDSITPFICPNHPLGLLNSSFTLPGIIQKTLKSTSETSSKSNISGHNALQIQPQNNEKSKSNESDTSNYQSFCENSNIKIKDSRGRKKSIGLYNETKKAQSEVIIHVCDEVKETSKDFSCPQELLISKMGYFADVTAGQKLEDMDISVHCDIQIFDWLMKWVKHDSKNQSVSENAPQLDSTNVVPILVSASFLQMEPLLLDCLSFCHSRLNDVVRSSANLSCLNDGIITRLAAMFTNIELEMVKDKKERITPRLWSKMILSLWEPEPQALKGHYFSLAGLFRCSRCYKYLTQSACSFVSCIPSNMRLNRWGQLISQHHRDISWDITTYIMSLYKELKTWRKVYWKLWGHCHFFYCVICETHFPAYQMNWCRFHPEIPQFLGPINENLPAGPAGRYACCGQQAFRYETLPGPNGCQYREHSIVVETDRDKAMLTLAQIVLEGGNLLEPPPARVNLQNICEPRWVGINLMPTKCRQGLLPALDIDEIQSKLSNRIRQGLASFGESSNESEESSDTTTEKGKKYINKRQFSTTSSDGCESEPNSPRHRRYNGRGRIKTSGRYWCGEVSARSNQDNQREFEERIMKLVISLVGKKTGSETNMYRQSCYNGGTYLRLEAEWKDFIRHKNNKVKLK